MYPTGDLKELEQRKAILQARIAIRRFQCVEAASQLARPVEQIDRGIALWHRIAPFAKLLALPAGLLATRFLGRGGGARRGGGKLRMLFTVLPLAVRGVKLVAGLRAKNAVSQRPP